MGSHMSFAQHPWEQLRLSTGCCSPSEHTRRCICQWFGLRLGRGSTEGPCSTGSVAAAPSPGVPGPPNSAVGSRGENSPFLPPLPFTVCSQCLSPAWYIPVSACRKELFTTQQDKINLWLGMSHALSLEGHSRLWLLPVSIREWWEVGGTSSFSSSSPSPASKEKV